MRQINFYPDTLQRVFGSFSLGSACFLATFILAAAFIALSIIGFPSRIIAIITGGSAITLIGYNRRAGVLYATAASARGRNSLPWTWSACLGG